MIIDADMNNDGIALFFNEQSDFKYQLKTNLFPYIVVGDWELDLSGTGNAANDLFIEEDGTNGNF